MTEEEKNTLRELRAWAEEQYKELGAYRKPPSEQYFTSGVSVGIYNVIQRINWLLGEEGN